MDEEGGRILVVDDDRFNRLTLTRSLESQGHTVAQAANGKDALAGLRNASFDVVLLDILMPEMDGFAVLDQMRLDPSLPKVPVIVISGQEDEANAVKCIEMGAEDFLPKPCSAVLLRARLGASLEKKRFRDQQENYRKELEQRVWEQTQDIQRSYQRLQDALADTVLALSSVVELRDPYTAGHQVRVTDLACAMATEMGLPEEQIEGIRVAGLLHDIGKIWVPSEILSRPGRISDVEFAIIRVHPELGHEILKNVAFEWPIADIVAQHHEALDGSGYPNGLTGDQLHLEAKIITVADVVEAMSTHRPYRASLGIEVALSEVQKHKGVKFHPEAVEACTTLVHDKGYTLDVPTGR